MKKKIVSFGISFIALLSGLIIETLTETGLRKVAKLDKEEK